MTNTEAKKLFEGARTHEYPRKVRCPRCGESISYQKIKKRGEHECQSAKCRPDNRTSGYRFKFFTDTLLEKAKRFDNYVKMIELVVNHPFEDLTTELIGGHLDLKGQIKREALRYRNAINAAMEPPPLNETTTYIVTITNGYAHAFELIENPVKSFSNPLKFLIRTLRIATDIPTLIRKYFKLPQATFTFTPELNHPLFIDELQHQISLVNLPPKSILKPPVFNSPTHQDWLAVLKLELPELDPAKWSKNGVSVYTDYTPTELMFYRYLAVKGPSAPKKILINALASLTTTRNHDIYTPGNFRPAHWK